MHGVGWGPGTRQGRKCAKWGGVAALLLALGLPLLPEPRLTFPLLPLRAALGGAAAAAAAAAAVEALALAPAPAEAEDDEREEGLSEPRLDGATAAGS